MIFSTRYWGLVPLIDLASFAVRFAITLYTALHCRVTLNCATGGLNHNEAMRLKVKTAPPLTGTQDQPCNAYSSSAQHFCAPWLGHKVSRELRRERERGRERERRGRGKREREERGRGKREREERGRGERERERERERAGERDTSFLYPNGSIWTNCVMLLHIV